MLKIKMLTCKEVAHLASQYADGHASKTLSLKIRLHLLMCKNCTRFIKHLQMTKKITSDVLRADVYATSEQTAEDLLAQLKSKQENS